MNTKTDKVLSIKDVADSFSKNLPNWQRKKNLTWLKALHARLIEGGMWGSPNLGTIYRKSGNGWVLMENFSDK